MASRRAITLFPLRTASRRVHGQCAAASFHTCAPARAPVVSLAAGAVSGARHGLRRGLGVWDSKRRLSGDAGAKDVPSRLYTFEDVNLLTSTPQTSKSKLLIDVREPAEYAGGTIPSALNIPVSSQPDALLLPAEEFEDRFGFSKPDPSKEVIFFCKAGVRSRAAAQIAKTAGYETVGEYAGSWNDWVGKGGKVERVSS